MAQRYFMRLAYRGAEFHGWQRQPNDISVQQVLEEKLAMVCGIKNPVAVTGAGRTDAGVNASMMVAHFDLDQPLKDEAQLVRALNSVVGKDIAVSRIVKVASDAHARFDAIGRTYYYYAVDEKNPFVYPLTWKAPAGLDYERMNEAASLLLEVDDFTSFAKLHTDVKTNICNVMRAEWVPVAETNGHIFIIKADRFLRNMVRAVVGTLVEVGRGKMSVEQFRGVIEARNRCMAGTSMPPEALFLHEVEYPYPLW